MSDKFYKNSETTRLMNFQVDLVVWDTLGQYNYHQSKR